MQNEPSAVDQIEQLIRELAAQPADRAVVDLTSVANRSIIELNKVARQEASNRRGQPEWGAWARLANAARSGVLQIAAVRDSLKAMPKEEPQT
jgi:hypothetical protein